MLIGILLGAGGTVAVIGHPVCIGAADVAVEKIHDNQQIR